MKDSLDTTSQLIRKAIEQAYNRGFQDGFCEAGKRVEHAFDQLRDRSPISVSQQSHAAKRPYGVVQEILTDILTNNPGLSAAELEKMVAAADPRLTGRSSVRNTLGRQRGRVFECQNKKWYLKETAAELQRRTELN